MTASRSLRGDWILIPPDTAAEWAPVLLAAKDTFSPDAAEAVERLDLLGAWFTNVSSVSPGVSSLDDDLRDSADFITVNEAAEIRGTTPQAITGRLRRGTLRGVQLPDRTWRVCAESVAKESK